MTVLTACQQAAILMSMEPPTSVYGSTDKFARELGVIANEAAEALTSDFDWRALTSLATITGDGVKLAFSLPDDYDRMPREAQLYQSGSNLPLTSYNSLDDWLDAENRGLNVVVGRYLMLGGKINISPVMSGTTSVKFYYQSKYRVIQGGTPQEFFTQDSNVFRIPEKLLKLEIMWRWRSSKSLEYAEMLRNSEIAKMQAQGAEKGPRTIAVGNGRWPMGVEMAWPGVITP